MKSDRHDLELRPARLREMAAIAERTAEDFPKWIAAFVERVSRELPD